MHSDLRASLWFSRIFEVPGLMPYNTDFKFALLMKKQYWISRQLACFACKWITNECLRLKQGRTCDRARTLEHTLGEWFHGREKHAHTCTCTYLKYPQERGVVRIIICRQYSLQRDLETLSFPSRCRSQLNPLARNKSF